MSIRVADHNDVSSVSSLVKSLSHFYLKDKECALPSWFADTLTEKAFLERITSGDYYNVVYELEGEVVGYLAMKGGSHLYHLFVSESHQGKGIARRLWEQARSVCVAETYTLRSSLFAVPVYQRFGFHVVGDGDEKEGIGFQAMELKR